MTTVPTQEWRKSSWSAQEADCVEIHQTLLSVRDSKNPAVAITADIGPLLSAIRDA
jgi:hypothetical protein